ncbi:MAG: heavy-metal-associated domain-containing protein [Synergistaceae bacterium]|nr:heavy-metal-associated domain-containing protein [Synergistaceae bacterium]
MTEYILIIPDMMCEHCAKRIRDAIESSVGTVKSLDLETKKVIVSTPLSAAELVALIGDAGYDAEVI